MGNLARTPDEERHLRHQANEVVMSNMKWAAGASLVPVPLLDLAGVVGVQVKMIAELAKLYRADFVDDLARSLVVSLLGGLGTGWLAAGAASSFFKVMPGLGPVVGLLSLPVMAAASTYATGTVFAHHFATGGNLFNFGSGGQKTIDEYQKAYEAGLKKGAEIAAEEGTKKGAEPALKVKPQPETR